MQQKLILVLLSCLALVNGQEGYPCNVENCLQCTYNNFCGLCNNNYILSINKETNVPFCEFVECDVDNCLTCLSTNYCYSCASDFYVNEEGLCTSGTRRCSTQYCSYCTEDDICQVCQYGFSLQKFQNLEDNKCEPNIPFLPGGCQIGFAPFICRMCQNSYLVAADWTCTRFTSVECDVENCVRCQRTDNSCAGCVHGYQLTDDNKCGLPPCNIENCLHCEDNQTCVVCNFQYGIQNNTCVIMIAGCNVENCIVCSAPEVCDTCEPGYQIERRDDFARCVKITQPSGTFEEYVSNCEKLVNLIAGTDTTLTIGCEVCSQGYINVGGFCVANISQQNYQCNVQNCQYCVLDNFCGKCKVGYHTQALTGGLCFKDYSPLPNCKLSIISGSCYLCEEGYYSYSGTCVKLNADFSCKVEGCDYCSAIDVCEECREGFTKSSKDNATVCVAICSQDNCLECGSSTTCEVCDFGYLPQNDGCVPSANATVDCSSNYGSLCTECNGEKCLTCDDDAVYNEDQGRCCYPSSRRDYEGCMKYSSVCSSTCVQCQPGYILIQSNCFKLPCSIENCVYCFRSQACVVCADGFTLKDGVCTQYTKSTSCPENCAACDGNGECTQCVNGYEPYQGGCVCGFQNCLRCMGDAFCTLCAFPTVGTGINQAGCSPVFVPLMLCQVGNCLMCKTPNMCSQCSFGFDLQPDGTCSQISCSSDSNCLLCDKEQTFCYQCKEGFIPNELLGYTCEAIPSNYACQVPGCGLCETSTTCETCLETFELTSAKQCEKIQCIDNCLVCLESSTCFLCDLNYYLNTNNTCIQINFNQPDCSSVRGCISCSGSSSRITCDVCDLGLQPSSDKTACVPQSCNSPNCQVCVPITPNNDDSTFCMICELGYHLNSYLQCVAYSPQIAQFSCDVFNCLFCDRNNSCALCALGWAATGSICETSVFCDVDNCALCTTADHCTTCNDSYTLNLGGCVPQCNITNCAECATLETCGACDDTFALSSDQKVCDCPDSTFSKQDNKCVCPTGKLLFNNTCVDCDVENCKFCSSANQCGECLDTFALSNNTCSCPATFELKGSSCVCPEGDKEFNNTCVECGVEFCASCDTPNNCVTCNTNFELKNDNSCQCLTGFTLFQGACYQCDDADFCVTCSNTNFCSDCNTTFEVSNGTCVCPTSTTLSQGACVECNIKNCDLCETANVCSKCAAKTVKLNELCIPCNIDNCASCSSSNVCSSCSNSLAVNSEGDQCVTCSVENCAQCSSNNVCSTCSNGFSFNKAGDCVDCSSVNGCEICSSDGVCATCLPGFGLSNGKCTVCASPCKTCNSDGTCATCQSPFSTTPNSNGGCFTCSVANCLSCTASNKNKCEQCAETYTLNTNTGQCSILCSTNLCLRCDDVQVCELCIEGYTPDGNGCKKCNQAPICKSCQPTATDVCTSCNDGYYLDGGVCKACAESNCAKCPTSASVCQEYKETTGQFTFQTETGEVVPAVCNAGCIKCSQTDPNKCINCMRGYSLQNGNCIPCASPCKTCKDGQPSKCSSCYSNAFLNGEACSTCTSSSNCLTCSSSNLTQCTSCPYGYSLNSDNVCVLGCPDNCLSCTSSSVCNICIEGYSVSSNGNCLPCLSNCRQCSGTQQGVCLSCGKGFFLNTEGTCSVCTEFCSSCNANGCTECVAGYALTSDFQCAKKCTTPCASCSTTDPSSCFSCLAGYSYDQTTSTCIPVTSCAENVCNVCPFGYILDVNSCFQCNSNCARCSSGSKDTCTSCYDGSYLRTSDSTCVSCPTGCDTCTTAANCLTCSSGFTAQSSPVDSIVNCVQCESPCQQCIGDSQTCTSCAFGFKLEGWKCLSTFNFGLVLVLNTDLTTFYSNYLSFLQTIAQALNSTNINVVTVISLVSGSVNFSGNGTTTQQSNSDGATNQYNNLSSTLASGNSIAGMQLTSSQVDVNGGDVQEQSSGPNLALILGITIPLAVILIGGLIYFFCCRKGDSYSSKPSEDTDMTMRQEFELSNNVNEKAL